MARIRIPAGVVTPEQALAECSLRYGDGMLHVTTRQDIQIHEVRIEDAEGSKTYGYEIAEQLRSWRFWDG